MGNVVRRGLFFGEMGDGDWWGGARGVEPQISIVFVYGFVSGATTESLWLFSWG